MSADRFCLAVYHLSPGESMVEYEPGRWVKILFRVNGSVLPRIVWRVATVVIVACAMTYLEKGAGYDLPNTVRLHMVVGVALGLLLVFRTNASYERFWEGRIQVGAMVSQSRDLARKTAAYLADSPAEVREQIGLYIIALFATIRRSLRRERDTSELAVLLTEEEREILENSSAPPLIVTRWLSDQFHAENRAGRVSDTKLRLFDPNLTELIELWGGAERILKTPVPFAYAHHIKGFLLLFLVTSPLALLDTMGWYTPLGVIIVAYGLFGIDEIGVEIEEPFGYDTNDLPMDGIGETIAHNVRDVLDLDPSCVPKPQDGKRGIYR
jgi:putative membrane protein